MKSPALRSAREVLLQRGYRSADADYNDVIWRAAASDLLVFVLQDVYLAEGWIESVMQSIELISRDDPDWGVLGLWGTSNELLRPVGHLWWPPGG